MAGQEITRLMNAASVRLPGATEGALQLELFAVMDDFFKGSNCWREDIVVQVGASDPAGTVYQLVPTGPALIDKLMWVYQTSTQPDILRGPQVAAAMAIPGELTLAVQPSSPISIVATVNLTVQDPTQRDGFVTFPLWVLQRYRDTILDGLLGRMMTQPNKPFSNTQMAIYHTRKFNSGVSHARVETSRNNTYRQQAWRFPGFAGGNQRGRRWTTPQ